MLDCPFKLYFDKINEEKKYIFDKNKSLVQHKNHTVGIDKNIYFTEEMRNFIQEKIIKKKYNPSNFVELVNAKFSSNINLTISNQIRKVNKTLFWVLLA